LSIRKNAPKLVINVGVDNLPDHLVKTAIVKEPDKAAIKEHIGNCFSPIAHYEQTQSLVIK
jgi:hypothetical protein